MISDTIITPGNNNKLANYIFSLKGNKIFYAILIIVLVVSIPILLTIIDGNFSNSDIKLDITKDIPNLLFYLLGLPTMLLTTIIYAAKFPKILEQLKNNNIIITNKEDWGKFKIKANEIYSKWYYTIGPHIMSFAITFSLFIIFLNPKNHIWYSLNISDHGFYFAGWAQLFIFYITFYIFSLGLFNIFASSRILRVLFTANKINVQPLHPDKCGGLAPLGNLSKILIYWIILIGIIIAFNVMNNKIVFGREYDNYLQISIIVGYLFMAYVIFFLPMHAAHKPMKKAKEEELELVHRYISRVNKKLKLDLKELKDVDNIAIENFVNAKNFYDVTNQMPVYPYNMKTIFSFISSVLIPIVLIIIEIYIIKVT